MPEFEIKVTITITGYESISAQTAEEAKTRMEELLERRFNFEAPLVQKSSMTVVEVSERETE